MNWDTILPLVAVIVAFIVALGGFFAWVSSYVDKRHEEHTKKVAELLTTLSEQIKTHHGEFHNEFRATRSRIEQNEAHLRQTREELYEKFVRSSEIDKLRDDMRGDFNNVFQKMGGISRSLNQLIGVITNKVHDEQSQG